MVNSEEVYIECTALYNCKYHQWFISTDMSRSVLAFSTQVCGFKPGRSRRIFRAKKFLSTPSFGGEVKPSVPCRRFAACKRSLNLRGSRNLGKNYYRTVPTFSARISRVVGGRGTWRLKWERLKAGESNGKLPPRTCPGCSVTETYRSHDWTLVPAKPGLQGWILMDKRHVLIFSELRCRASERAISFRRIVIPSTATVLGLKAAVMSLEMSAIQRNVPEGQYSAQPLSNTQISYCDNVHKILLCYRFCNLWNYNVWR